jgi:NAD(P)-dependent dehydrogenase (short-subunit alcohol dehydrogenase family)
MRNLAIVHMTKALSDQLGPDGITVNTVHPGVVETEHIHELYAKNAAAEGDHRRAGRAELHQPNADTSGLDRGRGR